MGPLIQLGTDFHDDDEIVTMLQRIFYLPQSVSSAIQFAVHVKRLPESSSLRITRRADDLSSPVCVPADALCSQFHLHRLLRLASLAVSLPVFNRFRVQDTLNSRAL